VRQGHARYLFRPLPALLRHLPVPSFMFRSGLADLQSEEGTYESTRHAQRKRSEYRRCCTKRVSYKAQFKRAVRPARITVDIRIEANTLSSQQLRSCFRVLLNALRVSAIASRGSSVNREAKLKTAE
jgi:hypothetical protein